MAITGGIKFFDKSKCLAVDGGDATGTTGDNSADYSIDRNAYTVWRSVGSSDVTTENLTITFPSATFSRLIILGHNLKQFTVKYGPSGYSTDFASVVGLDGALVGGIAETVFADNVAYYEFNSVTTTGIRIAALKTQTANQEKYVSQVILTNELGTLVGFPVIEPVRSSRNSKVQSMLSGRKNIIKSIETFSFSMGLDPYPANSTYTADVNLLMSLYDMDEPFLAWLCGGRRGTTYFGYPIRGFRLLDVIPMQISNVVESSYLSNIYKAPIQTGFEFEEITLL